MARGLGIAGVAALLTALIVGAIRILVIAGSGLSGVPERLIVEIGVWSLVFWVGVGLLIAAVIVRRGSKRGAGLYELAVQNPLTHFQVSPTQRSAEAWGLRWGGTYVLVIRDDQLEVLAPGGEGIPYTEVVVVPLTELVRVTTVDVYNAGQARLAVGIEVADRGSIELFLGKGRNWWFAPASSVQNLATRLAKSVSSA